MKYARQFTALLVALCAAGATEAQFVKGNEAVTAGGKQVEVPAPRGNGSLCRIDGKCHASAWLMVETPSGLMECTEPFARPGTCRASTYGTQKLRRVWVVKTGGQWRQCQYPDLHSTCVPVFAPPPANLPVDALQ